MHDPQLTAFEHRAYRSVVDDGLIDLLLGVFILLLGFTVTHDPDSILVVWLVASPFIWRWLRSRLIEPRIGYVQLNVARSTRIKRGKQAMVAAVGLYVIALLTFVCFQGSLCQQPVDWGSLRTAGLLGAVLALGGHFLEMKRWFGYAAMAVAMGTLEFTANLAEGTGLLLSGSATVAGGAFLLGRFLHRNPQLHPETPFGA